jgi:maltose alpha-D-glucosyltransferase/alpha-amylase
VIYYGDEIGMGDNIWLEDRDGVRTPMQWSNALNAGFSPAGPEALYAPVIVDEEYGHQRVNVEAQRRDSRSLLRWTQNAIAVRNSQPALSRGEIQFVRSTNSAVLAYWRTYLDQVILIVNNLSSQPQAAELDLGAFAGTQPADLLTGKELSPIGSAPYQMEMERYQYHWLRI